MGWRMVAALRERASQRVKVDVPAVELSFALDVVI